MSVSRSLYAVSAADLERVLSQPSLVLELVRSAPNSIAAKDLPRREYDIDCAWDAIHFVLANGETDLEDFPSTFLYCGGTPVGDIDVGYGPAQAFRPADVASIAGLLESIGEDAFSTRFDHERMQAQGTYRMDGERDEDHEYVLDHYRALRDFVIAAARKGDGLFVT